MMKFGRHRLTANLQKYCWVYLTDNFIIDDLDRLGVSPTAVPFVMTRITLETASRVADFREADRSNEYRQKVSRHEIGLFAESEGRAAGSIWATLNSGFAPIVARTYMPLQPQHALVHDVVVGERFRGRRLGASMIVAMVKSLFEDFGVERVIIDVSARNAASQRMMQTLGLRAIERVLSVSLFGGLAFRIVLHRNPPAQYSA
jgi:RimJ/RimL family protein N-acetyltransferase